MNLFYVICLYLLVQFCSSTPQHNNHRNGYEIAVAVDKKGKNTASGCLHNNTLFADTSIVPTSEPCLVCKCSKRNLLCVRRVCKDQPYPPPRGCILVYKKSMCCPYLSCSKYHINFYKNTERNRDSNGHHSNNNYHVQLTHEKVSEKHYRTDDTEEMNGGCIESGSLYASGSAMHRSSATQCTYCYCINGQQKCIKPKCMLRNTKCKPIFMEASCCPIKYDCNGNSSALSVDVKQQQQQRGSAIKLALMKRKNRSNGCVVDERQFHEGERLPHDDKRPCEVCYCIKGARKCTVKKCAPVIRGCVPKMPEATGICCPTSYDCRRSIKYKRESRQEQEEDEPEEEEEDNDTIDFFSLLFGSDDPKETDESATQAAATTAAAAAATTQTTPPPFKALPSTTESSFFDLIRAGLEMIDANADKIDSHLSSRVTTPSASSPSASTTERKVLVEASTTEAKTTDVNELTKGLPSVTESFSLTSTTAAATLPMKSVLDEEHKRTEEQWEGTTKTTKAPATTTTTRPTTTRPAVTTAKSTTTTTKLTRRKESSTIKTSTSAATTARTSPISTTKAPRTTTAKQQPSSTKTAAPAKVTAAPTVATRRVIPTATTTIMKTTRRPTTASPTSVRTTSKTYIVPSILQSQQQRIPVQFTASVVPDTKLIVSDENEADTLPNLEIIPFVAHDAIKTDKYEPYRPSATGAAYDNLEKDYFAGDKEKPFRYNNKFIHHNYDETLDYVYTNPHDRIDSGPYYYENENQFESFSPPSEQDFLGGFSPKESIYDEVSTSAGYELPLKHNDYAQKPLDTATAAEAAHENKSNLTSTATTTTTTEGSTAALAINQTSVQQPSSEQSTVPNFKKISSNFTSFIDDLLQANVLDDEQPVTVTSTKVPSAAHSSTSAPIKSIINDNDFIIQHLRPSTTSAKTTTTTTTTTRAPGSMEIFSKPTSPAINNLLKLAGCNIYGQMYEVGQVIDELSSRCLECKCLPDIGVGCMPLKC